MTVGRPSGSIESFHVMKYLDIWTLEYIMIHIIFPTIYLVLVSFYTHTFCHLLSINVFGEIFLPYLETSSASLLSASGLEAGYIYLFDPPGPPRAEYVVIIFTYGVRTFLRLENKNTLQRQNQVWPKQKYPTTLHGGGRVGH